MSLIQTDKPTANPPFFSGFASQKGTKELGGQEFSGTPVSTVPSPKADTGSSSLSKADTGSSSLSKADTVSSSLSKADTGSSSLSKADTVSSSLSKADTVTPAQLDNNLEPSEPEQTEDMVMLYIKLLDPADKYFLQYQKIYDNGEKYIAYLKSPEYLQYRKARRTFDAKYSNNKKFSVTVVKKKVTAFSRDKSGQPAGQIDTLTKPTYIHISVILEKAHTSLLQTRIMLDNTYGRLLDKPFISQQVKATFTKRRDSLITKINDFYALQYYYHKINGLTQTNKLVTLPKISSYYSENSQELLPRITTKEVSISQDDIAQQRTNATNKLELYNKIKAQMLDSKRDAPMSKELKELIQSYITFDETNNKELDSLIERKKKHSRLEYLVVPPGLEIPDNNLIKPKDLRPFYASKKSASSGPAS